MTKVLARLDSMHPNRIVLESAYEHKDEIQKMLARKWSVADKVWTMPLAWSTCLQLRSTFGEDLEIAPDLAAWASKHKKEVIDPAMTLREVITLDEHSDINEAARQASKLKDEIKLFPHQAAGAAFMATNAGCGIFDETGTGKSAQTISALRAAHRAGDTNIFPVLVVAPNSVKRTWQRELKLWWPGLIVHIVDGSPTHRRKIFETPGHVYIVNYEQMHRHSRLARYGSTALKRCTACGGLDEKITNTQCEVHERELNQIKFQTVVTDECFTAGTKISTPTGQRNIEDLRPGDIVYGFDHEIGRVVENVIDSLYSRDADSVIAGVNATPNHPYFVEGEGYRPIGDLTADDKIVTFVPGVQQPTYQLESGEVLLRRMQNAGSKEVLGVSKRREARYGKQSADHAQADMQRLWLDVSTAIAEKSRAGKATAMLDVLEKTSVGVSHQDDGWSSVAELLHSRHSFSTGESSCGDRRLGSSPAQRVRPATYGETRSDGLVGYPVLAVRDSEGYDRLSKEGAKNVEDKTIVYSLSTATGNYFADDVLVRNCHRMLHPSKQTRAIWSVSDKAARRYALTGTPIQDNINDFWFILRYIRPEEFPSKTRFIDRYADVGYSQWGMLEIYGIKKENEQEFRAITQPLMRRMLKKIVLPFLPPIIRERRYIPLTPPQRKLYKQMVKEAMITLDSDSDTDFDTLVASSPLSVNTRLLQFASSYGEIIDVPVKKNKARIEDTKSSIDDYLDVDEVVYAAEVAAENDIAAEEEIEYQQQLRLALPSNKITAFLSDIDGGDFGDSSIVVFAQSRQLIELLSAEMTKKKLEHGLITGSQTTDERQQHIDDFQDGKTKYILVTIQAGGVGLTLTAANVNVFLQRAYSSTAMSQALSRSHRIGAQIHDSVTIIDYISEQTMEEKQLIALSEKDGRIESILKDKDLLRKFLEIED